MSKYVIPDEAYGLWNVLLIAQPKFMPPFAGLKNYR